MQNLLKRTHAYLKTTHEIELSEEQVRVAMNRLSVHYRILAKWHSEDEKHAASAALPVQKGDCKDAC